MSNEMVENEGSLSIKPQSLYQGAQEAGEDALLTGRPERRNVEQLQAVYNLTNSISRAGAIEDIYEEALNGLQRTVRADRTAILLFDPDAVMRFKAWRGISEGYRKAVEGHSPWPADETDPAPVLIPDVEAELGFGSLREVIAGEGIRAIGFIPLVSQRRLLGKFMVYYNTPHNFSEYEMMLTQIVASQVAFAIERKRSEDALRKSEEFNKQIIESSNDCIKVVDLEGNLLYMSKGGHRLLEICDIDLMVNTSWPSFWQGEYKQLALEAIERAKAEGVGNFQGYCATALGSPRWWDVVITPIYDAAGKVERLLSISRDITEQKRSEALMMGQMRTLELIVKGAPLRVVLEALARTVEEEAGEGAVASILLLDEDGIHLRHGGAPSLPDSYNEAIDGIEIGPNVGTCGVAAYYGKPVVTADIATDPNWAAFSHLPLGLGLRSAWSMPVLSSDGRVLASFGTYFRESREPTARERQIVEIMSRTAAIAIERKRAEETREQLLASEQAARAEAETANRLKDEFLATVSHELRTPLNAMLGWAQLLRTGKLDQASVTRALDVITNNARAQAQIINDILDVSRIITGKLKLEARPVAVAPIIEAVVDGFRPAAEAKSIKLQIKLDPDVKKISGDADRLRQIVWNLLSNSIKFTSGGGVVRLRLEQRNSHIELAVSDTGQGINPPFLPYVFDRFRQADSSTSRQHGGLGLGLAIVRHLVELHGGTVSAHSGGQGQGATFTVRLPLVFEMKSLPDVGAGPASQERAGGNGKPEPVTDLQQVRVLVVDDEESTRELLKILLGQCGAEVKAAASASEAVEAMRKWKPDLLISDIGMPVEDGYGLIQKVREMDSDQGGDIPAVALTAYAREEDKTRALSAGYQMHLPKPVDPTELIRGVVSLTSHKRK